MKGKSHAQEEAERSVKSPGGNAELNICKLKYVAMYTINTRILH